jgi:hypothetical protein
MKGYPMKIELLVARAGPSGSQNRGDVIDVSDAEAIRMIEAGQAVAVRSAKPETAVKPSRAEKAKRG